ncbi:MAG: DUF3593 domain-containing protein [Gloeocapsa sp. DLM2.Bin57]|nr:MAG: DUF3593 domain-containing protein [Gloeocapsa sp. DLM2.Bin57]
MWCSDTPIDSNLANIDWLHGGAEFFLTVSNLVVVLGFSQAILRIKNKS